MNYDTVGKVLMKLDKREYNGEDISDCINRKDSSCAGKLMIMIHDTKPAHAKEKGYSVFCERHCIIVHDEFGWRFPE